MGAWDTNPWDNDAAADWFSSLFEGVDVDGKVGSALEAENSDVSRAAAYFLSALGRLYVWPGDVNKLASYLERAIQRMEDLRQDERYLVNYQDREGLLASIAVLIGDLRDRRSELGASGS